MLLQLKFHVSHITRCATGLYRRARAAVVDFGPRYRAITEARLGRSWPASLPLRYFTYFAEILILMLRLVLIVPGRQVISPCSRRFL